MGKALEELPPLRAYTINLAGSLAGVALFALILLPAAAAGGVVRRRLRGRRAVPARAAEVGCRRGRRAARRIAGPRPPDVGLHALVALLQDHDLTGRAGDGRRGEQHLSPVDGAGPEKEYFYQWPYTVFGDGFDDVLILGAGSGTDVAASLLHGTKHIDAVEIDPVIVRLGREHHPDMPYSDPRVNVVTDDARHFLRTTDKKYDLVVFALIDSLTLQSSFTSVRLESYMFTEESFRSVRERLKPNGVLVIYNYFRERWLVDRLANTAARAFDQEPRVFVHQEHALSRRADGRARRRSGADAGRPFPSAWRPTTTPTSSAPGSCSPATSR